ncbi:24083_t:CDS:1 [Dentiscutata erythropus]|uniref:24083_t:CDS:1 n=1 Tax=Dentiscutata erythropus TaxID=1348616 RepID=A0A9N9F1F1_9GLOM|nr:24083_t:CDS:1 [Dentiscutata erythropus]
MESTKEGCIKNILLIGKTGCGKSTLANVLTNTYDFKESYSAKSETKNVQAAEFKHDGVKFRVIDTIGIDDTDLPQEQVLYQILQGATYYIEKGLDYIFFVFNSSVRFNREEKRVYELFEGETIFGERLGDYATIIMTRYSKFKSPERCEEYKRSLNDNQFASEIAIKCEDVIFIDNDRPEDREESRRILLNYLITCKKEDSYKPNGSLADFCKIVNVFDLFIEEMNEKINKLFEIFKSLEKMLPNLENNRKKTIDCIETNKMELSKELMNLSNNNDNNIILSGLSTTLLRYSELGFLGAAANTAILTAIASSPMSLLIVIAPMIPLWVNSFLYIHNGNLANSKEKKLHKEFSDIMNEDYEGIKMLIVNLNELNKIHEDIKDIIERYRISQYKKEKIDKNKIEIFDEIITENFEVKKLNHNEKEYDYSNFSTIEYIKDDFLGFLGYIIPFFPLSGIRGLVALFNKSFNSQQVTEEEVSKKTFCKKTFSDMENITKSLEEGLSYIKELRSNIDDKIEKCNKAKEDIGSILKHQKLDSLQDQDQKLDSLQRQKLNSLQDQKLDNLQNQNLDNLQNQKFDNLQEMQNYQFDIEFAPFDEAKLALYNEYKI